MSRRNGTTLTTSAPTTAGAPVNRESYTIGRTAQTIDKVSHYGWHVVDDPGEFRWVAKERLLVDPDYQREESAKKVLAIAAEWSWLACGVLLVARRSDGRLYVYDGNHRVVAARNRSDIRELPCLVFSTCDVAAEAMGFLRANTHRKSVGAAEKFRAQVMIKDEAALLVDRLIRDHDLQVQATGSAGPREVKCLGAVMKIARTQPDILEQVWPLLVQLAQEGSMHERVVESIVYVQSRLVARGESLLVQPWKGRILKLGRAGIVEAAAKAAAFYSAGGAGIWAKGLVNALNRNVRHRLVLTPAVEAEE